MSRSYDVKASKSSNDQHEESWSVPKSDVLELEREHRSAKPEMTYHLGTVIRPEQNTDDLDNTLPIPQPSQPVAPELENQSGESADLENQPEESLEDLSIEAPQDFQSPTFHSPNNLESEDDVFFTSDDMADDKNVMPSTFSGSGIDDAQMWLRHFENYCKYKDYNKVKALALLKVLFVGNAAIWLDSLPQDVRDDYNHFIVAFEERYKKPELLTLKSAKERFSRKQGNAETVDDFIAHMRKLANQIEADERLTRYAIQNGLKPHISAYVTQQKCESLDQLIDAARLAEITMPEPQSADNTVLSQSADMRQEMRNEIRQMTNQWSKLTTSPLLERRPLSRHQAPGASPFKLLTMPIPETLSRRPQTLGTLGAADALGPIIDLSEIVACQLNV